MACSPQQAREIIPAEPVQSVHPVSGLKIVPLTVTSGKQRHAFDVEVAQTLQDQAKGLMFRTELAPDEGMIFPRNPPDMASFWMKNTPLPLDIIFVGVDNRIINIAAETVPYSLDPVASADIAGAVLEIPGGRAAELGIKPGDLVEWGK
ncbi:MAG: DUF192 domain-containing protein [Pontixanthobacter sp.]